MTIDYLQLLPQVEAMGVTAVQLAQARELQIPQALEVLHRLAELEPGRIEQRIEKAGEHWRGARPTSEAAAEIYPPPALQQRMTVIGADGSQIFPDRHALALYYLVNVASISVELNSGLAPKTRSLPRLFFSEEDLYDAFDGLIQNDFISMLRDLWELEELADAAEQAGNGFTLTLLDNGLLLYPRLQEGTLQRKQDAMLGQYLVQLDRLRKAQVSLAGFIDRPSSAEVLRLVHLAGLPEDALDQDTIRHHPYRGTADRTLFSRLLPPGHRSARFAGTSQLNRTFAQQGHSIQFFYLHTGYQDLIARVEIPEWVGEDPESLSLVHAGLLEQCGSTGIPYVLVRAHELAVVSRGDREALERMVRGSMLKHHLNPSISQKARTKTWTG